MEDQICILFALPAVKVIGAPVSLLCDVSMWSVERSKSVSIGVSIS